MSEENEALVRSAYEAYDRGEVTRLLELVHPDLEWTYLDPSFENPQPQVCHARDQLAWALGRQADQGVDSELEEIDSCGDKVMVAVHTPGADQHRAWQGNDRNYLVLTLRQRQVVAMRAFRDLDAARSFTSEGGQSDEAPDPARARLPGRGSPGWPSGPAARGPARHSGNAAGCGDRG
jgi:ketosteroid isomerase-like protein